MQRTEHLHTHDHDGHEHHHAARDTLRDWARVFILLGLAAYFAYNILSGNLSNYVNARFAWLSYVAIVLFGLLGFASMVALLRGGHDHAHDHDHDHEHGGMSWVMIAIVAVPLVLGTLVPSEPLSASAVNGGVSMTPISIGGATATAFSRDPLDRNVLEWLRVFIKGAPDSFNEQEADVIGFVYREPGYPPDHFLVARFTISCCVADASAIGLPAVWTGSGDLADGQWVRVRGAFQAGDFANRRTPILQAAQVEVVDQPDHPYLYP